MTFLIPESPNDSASYWYYEVEVNVIPRIGKIPIIPYKQYRNKRIPEELFNQWENEGRFNHNMCVMIGKLSGHTEILQYARKGLYLNFADFDNELAIREFCNWKGKQFTLEQISNIVYVVQHSDDSTHAHVYWLSSKSLPKRTLDKDKKILEQIRNNEHPAVEIKAQGDVAFCPGGYHETGNPYLPIGTNELCIIEELGEHIESICRKYKLPVSDTERNKLRLAKTIRRKKFCNSSTKTLLMMIKNGQTYLRIPGITPYLIDQENIYTKTKIYYLQKHLGK
jgi:hypothetical protein